MTQVSEFSVQFWRIQIYKVLYLGLKERNTKKDGELVYEIKMKL